mgnify:CR=1 FL=1
MLSDEFDFDSTTQNENSDIDEEFKPKFKSTKRKLDAKSWKRNIAKESRNSGKSYVSVTTGKNVPGKKFGRVKECCKKKLVCFHFQLVWNILYFLTNVQN